MMGHRLRVQSNCVLMITLPLGLNQFMAHCCSHVVPLPPLDNSHFKKLTLLIVQLCFRNLLNLAKTAFTAQLTMSCQLDFCCQLSRSLLAFGDASPCPLALKLNGLGADRPELANGRPRLSRSP